MIRRTLLKRAALAAAAPAFALPHSLRADGRRNAIVAEDQRPGTSDWQLTFVRNRDLRSQAIEGYGPTRRNPRYFRQRRAPNGSWTQPVVNPTP